ncbi:hypothetical protein E6H23_07650 [Candidatus Bathyarchaeota archaeon]|nr:MAG: hypothetical protein E6H23_07650 [Candidatus Bathyarchaeota archaeon]
MKHTGWILDLYPKAGQMIIWIKRTDGSHVRLIDPWKPRIHIGGNYRDLLELACQPEMISSKFVEKYEKAGDREKSRVLEVEVDGDREASDLAKKIQKTSRYSKFRFYDIDIPSPQMYLYHKNLFPLALVEAEETSRGVDWTLQDSRESCDYQIPPLKTVKLQVNTKKTRKIRTFEDELDSVEIAGDCGSLTIDSGNEPEKILGLVEAFQVEDPDVVVTEGGDSFIFPYLARRSQENNILDKLILGRDPSPLHVYEVQGHSYFSYGKILYRETAARLLGRLHVDQHNAFISADCGLTGLFEVSRTCIMPIQRASRATIGTNMTSLQLYHAVKQDVLIPWNKNQPEEWKDGNELVVADRGGFIYEPEYGIHDHIGELDFTSLYPKIMWQKNLSGETVKCSCCPDSTNRVPELDYNICQRWTGIVPLSLEILLTKRAIYKTRKKEATDETARSLYDQRQSALKWILVCCLPYDSPVLISQDGKVSYQHIGKVIDDQLGGRIGVFDCTKELFVAGLDKDLRSTFSRVTKLIKTISPKQLLHVKMDDGRQVRCTSNHSFYILRNGLLVEVKAADLSKGDLVPTAKRIVPNNTTISNIDLLQHIGQQIEESENDLWRAKSNELRSLVNSSSNTLEVVLKREGRQVQNLTGWHSRITRLLDSDIGFAAVKEIEQIESPSPYVYCFEVSDYENFPAFFTGSGGVLVHNSFGYLGFKNARFGKIDAHIATCAFSRKVLKQAVAMAEAHGFQLVHGIVDSMWLRKPSATAEEYEELCSEISRELNLPISFEGIYKWVVFLNSKIDPRVPVLNRYYGIFQDGTVKVRGIDLRRHDTPGIVRQCQEEMLGVFSKANNSSEFKLLIPKALNVLERYAILLRKRKVPLEDLVIEKNLSKDLGEYTHKVPQAIAARHLVKEGGTVHAGQRVNYILTLDWAGVPEKLALPPELADENTVYDSERYIDLLCSSATNLLLPMGYTTKSLRSMLQH